MQIRVEKINGKEYAVWKVYHTLANYEDLRNFMNTNISGEPFCITDFHWTLVHEDEYEILKQGIELFGYEEVFSESDRKCVFEDADKFLEGNV